MIAIFTLRGSFNSFTCGYLSRSTALPEVTEHLIVIRPSHRKCWHCHAIVVIVCLLAGSTRYHPVRAQTHTLLGGEYCAGRG
ncbi:hypothetical protein PENSPDRAFT_25865 [Peniophora sp. CONT]|nr:hypothetical protein PENSPDRAFT_25865 [Peniophora sp. CONT]